MIKITGHENLTICPTGTETFGRLKLRQFTLDNTEFNIEEAISIVGFIGYVEDTAHGPQLMHTTARFPDGSHRPIIGVAFDPKVIETSNPSSGYYSHNNR